MSIEPQYEAVIVGAGFGGMGIAIELQRLGITSMLILERADDLGGTWHLNHYPGLAVDIASVTYSYSFEMNPDWSRRFAPGTELKTYADRVADKYGLRQFMRFHSSVEQVVYDEANQLWTVHIAEQQPVTARTLVLATGYLSRPQRPNIAGIDSFQGKVIHTAAWDDSYSLQGKRAAVIGTGATGVQLIPSIAPEVAQLDVYQRTAIWCGPKPDHAISSTMRRWYARLPLLQRILRALDVLQIEFLTNAAILQHQRFPWMTYIAEQACRLHIRRQVKDRELRKKLTPNYPFGCKRPTFSNQYYRAFNRDNVALITNGIDRIEADAIVTSDGTRRPTDVLVLATGFKLWERDTFHSIVGRGGVELRDHWERTRYESYEGLTIPGFPNLFYLPAPYSYTGLSYFFTLEGQMKHIARVLTERERRKATAFEPRAEAAAKYVDEMQQRLTRSVFIPGQCTAANSYYFDQHGAPSLVRPMTVLAADYRHSHFPLSDYLFA